MTQRPGVPCVICGKQAHARNLCAKHYYRVRRNGTLGTIRFEQGMSLADKFTAIMGPTPPESGCWDWEGSGEPYGLVSSTIHGSDRAHRIAYRLFVGPIPEGLHVLHSCDRPICVQPKHLSAGTRLDNMRQASERGRLTRPGLGLATGWNRVSVNRSYRWRLDDTIEVRRSGDGTLSRPEWEIVDLPTGQADGGYLSAKDARFVAERRMKVRR